MTIQRVTEENIAQFTELSCLLFPEEDYDLALQTYKQSFSTDREVEFLYQQDGKCVGMMHLSVRTDYVNGTNTSPVLYLEAIYVLPGYRNKGIARELIAFSAEYAKLRGITQIASDCMTDNHSSEAFHKSCGFREEERVICFVKDIE